jgi:hypothetical protein
MRYLQKTHKKGEPAVRLLPVFVVGDDGLEPPTYAL